MTRLCVVIRRLLAHFCCIFITSAACAIHDICYGTPDRVRALCDREFRHNMLQACRFSKPPYIVRETCDAYVEMAYQAVNLFAVTRIQVHPDCFEIESDLE